MSCYGWLEQDESWHVMGDLVGEKLVSCCLLGIWLELKVD